MQSGGQHKYDFISTYTILHFLSELLHSHTPGMGVVVLYWWTQLYPMGKVRVTLQFFMYKFCMPGFPAVLAWLHRQVRNKCAHKSTCYCFSQELNDHLMHLFHDVPQSMGYSYVQNRKSSVTGCSNGQHRDQYSRWRHRITFRGQRTLYRSSNVSYTCTKRFQVWTLTFKKCKGSIETKLPCRKKPSWVIR